MELDIFIRTKSYGVIMPRKPREKSPHDLYHIVFRGTNKQVLFESKYDYMRFLEYMQRAKEQMGFELHAYCLMSNHIHMLIKIQIENLSKLANSISTPYAHFYNLKYCRTGSLFESRFGSVPIMTTQQYMKTIRYIHQNPVHATLISNQDAHKYPWSSLKEFKQYSKPKNNINDSCLCDHNIVMDNFKSIEFFSFHNSISNDCSYEHEFHQLTDQEAMDIIRNTMGHTVEFLKDVQKLDIKCRNEYLSEIKKLKLSNTQISRLTGIGRNIIQRVK